MKYKRSCTRVFPGYLYDISLLNFNIMALQNTTTLRVAETEITAFKSISLFQEIDAHHDLEVVCRMDVLENLSATLGEASKNFLGEIITLQTASLDTLSGYKNL